jgi:hypothetical protein
MPAKPRPDNPAAHEQSVTIDPVWPDMERKWQECVL